MDGDGGVPAALVDAAEFLPYALLAAAAFGLVYLRAGTRPAPPLALTRRGGSDRVPATPRI
ncbi:hypothetical protein [Micromonospora sp. CB01531]|uniref:hypothetical protein n=1 Tax=Micromonospora sp. CB01531 TaxID=1718947 RepID=UPI00093C58BD|nr:hypothetical protein [Micromonospora sp. CB01531]OKI44713.1 hypothetical protein A6A27_38330 [Micromonospora sp. CB01531]